MQQYLRTEMSLKRKHKRNENTKRKHIQIFTSIHNNFCLTQLYFTCGDMFRLLIQPSSGQLTIEQDLLCAHNMGSHTVYIKYM